MNEIEPLYVQYLDTEPIQVDQLDAKREVVICCEMPNSGESSGSIKSSGSG
jgi:hypothetical protein